MDKPARIIRQSIYLYEEHWAYLREYAHFNHLSMSGVVRKLIDKLAEDEDLIRPKNLQDHHKEEK